MKRFFLLLTIAFYSFTTQERGQILYLMKREECDKSFDLYISKAKQEGHDFDLLKEMGILLLTQGAKHKDKEIRLLSLFGATVAAHPDLLPIYAHFIKSSDLTTQLAALAGLSEMQDDEADLLLLDALSSPFLLTRLESALTLSQKNHPQVLGHLQSLMTKVPAEIRPIFPQIIVQFKDAAATSLLRQLLSDPETEVKIETVRFLAKEGRDDFLPIIQSLAVTPHAGQQEVCLFALGQLKDWASIPLIKSVAEQKEGELKLAAASALVRLGQAGGLDSILEEAEKENLFAIQLLGDLGDEAEPDKLDALVALLLKHSKSLNANLRFNSGMALLKLRHSASLPILKEFLLTTHKGLGLCVIQSSGRTLSAFKVIPSADILSKKQPEIATITLKIKNGILTDALELSEKDFLDLAENILAGGENALVPHIIELLCHHKTEKVMQFFAAMQQKAGAPLVRNYCLLARYRLGEEKETEAQVLALVEKEKKTALIRLKEGQTPKTSDQLSKYYLTPEESSALLISAFELFLMKQSEKGILALVQAMHEGNPKNKYPLAGLLIKGVE